MQPNARAYDAPVIALLGCRSFQLREVVEGPFKYGVRLQRDDDPLAHERTRLDAHRLTFRGPRTRRLRSHCVTFRSQRTIPRHAAPNVTLLGQSQLLADEIMRCTCSSTPPALDTPPFAAMCRYHTGKLESLHTNLNLNDR